MLPFELLISSSLISILKNWCFVRRKRFQTLRPGYGVVSCEIAFVPWKPRHNQLITAFDMFFYCFRVWDCGLSPQLSLSFGRLSKAIVIYTVIYSNSAREILGRVLT